MFPITMPYCPEDKPYKVFTEELLTDRLNGDFDTVAIQYAICPDGNRVDIERFFKEGSKEFEEIKETEYLERKLMHKERLRKEQS